jgi:hypothetical protein
MSLETKAKKLHSVYLFCLTGEKQKKTTQRNFFGIVKKKPNVGCGAGIMFVFDISFSIAFF